MIKRGKEHEMFYFILSLILIPVLLALSIFSEGHILPTLNFHESWTVEYVPFIIASMIGCYFSFRGYLKTKKKIWFYPTIIFNIISCIFILFTMVYLWGEKY
jgi:hypothetical protein